MPGGIVTIRGWIHPRNYAALLLAVITLMMAVPFLHDTPAERVVMTVLLTVILLVSSLAMSPSRGLSLTAFACACLAAILWALFNLSGAAPFNTVLFKIATYAAALAFFATVVFIMLSDILTGTVTGNRICGAICVYLLMGVIFALLYLIAVSLNPQAFSLTDYSGRVLRNLSHYSFHDLFPVFLYYSFSTLSTLGYGDIIPLSRFAREVAALEAISGQLYLTVLVARLVGLHIIVSHRSDAGSSSTPAS